MYKQFKYEPVPRFVTNSYTHSVPILINSCQAVLPGYLHSVSVVARGGMGAHIRDWNSAVSRFVEKSARGVPQMKEWSGGARRRVWGSGETDAEVGEGPDLHPVHTLPPGGPGHPGGGDGRSAIGETDTARTWFRRIGPKCGMNCWCQSVAHFHPHLLLLYQE